MTKAGHIFLIDDDESMRVSLSRMLRELGYLVEDYPSAAIFLEKSVPVSLAVILLDRVRDKMHVNSIQVLVRKYLESRLENHSSNH